LFRSVCLAHKVYREVAGTAIGGPVPCRVHD